MCVSVENMTVLSWIIFLPQVTVWSKKCLRMYQVYSQEDVEVYNGVGSILVCSGVVCGRTCF